METSATSALPARLRARRRAAGLTQLELANRAGLSVRTVQGIESGEFDRPRPSTLRRLDDVLHAARARRRLPSRAVRTYAATVPTTATSHAPAAPARDEPSSYVLTTALPDRYARPARRLATRPTGGSPPLFWLELERSVVVATPGRAQTEPRVTVCRAVPAGARWLTTVLARGVTPLDGVELVDALRAFRGSTDVPGTTDTPPTRSDT